jgi:uncharacterized protein YndB with AHSA1/START domain
MSEEEFRLPPFRVEVVVAAPAEAVWRALTDPEECRRWFGWDDDGLDAEIRYIFVDQVTPVGRERLEHAAGQRIELEADGPRTIVRIVSPGPLDDASWDELYDEIVQGWHTFLHQLRFYLERHPGQDRRTVFLTGQVVPAAAYAALEAAAPGATWAETRHQRSVAVDRWGGGLVSLVTAAPRDSREPARGQLTVTAYGLDEASVERVEGEWTAWWRGLAAPGAPRAGPGPGPTRAG